MDIFHHFDTKFMAGSEKGLYTVQYTEIFPKEQKF